jgi:geranylgeranyl diphosphate synthase type I
MSANLGKQYLVDYSQKTNPLLLAYLEEKIVEAGEISKVPAELLKRFLGIAQKGKRLRGGLVKLAYEACGGKDEKEILSMSWFVELFHAGLLVQDDVMDRDHLRRGVKTIHKQFEDIGRAIKIDSSEHYGESMAMCSGDIAFYLSWEKLIESKFPVEILINAAKVYVKYALGVVHGQVLDITNVAIKNLSERDILKVLRYKTAEYTGVMPLLIGATLAGEKNKKKLKAFEEYGLALGWSFQIQDDILGLYGEEEKLGKPIGSDLKEGKMTLLMLHLLKHGNAKQKAFQKKILGKQKINKEEVKKMRKIVKEAGSYGYVVKMSKKYVQQGKKQVPLMTKDRKLQAVFEALLNYIIERVK